MYINVWPEINLPVLLLVLPKDKSMTADHFSIEYPEVQYFKNLSNGNYRFHFTETGSIEYLYFRECYPN